MDDEYRSKNVNKHKIQVLDHHFITVFSYKEGKNLVLLENDVYYGCQETNTTHLEIDHYLYKGVPPDFGVVWIRS